MERGLIRDGGLVLTQNNDFLQMIFCIPSALLPLKSQCYRLRKLSHLGVFSMP